MALLPRHKRPNLALWLSELSRCGILVVLSWHFVRNGRWHPTAIGCGHPPASKSTFGRRSPLDVSMSKTVSAHWTSENIFSATDIDRYYIVSPEVTNIQSMKHRLTEIWPDFPCQRAIKRHQQQQSSTFLDLQHMSFRTKKSTCLAKNTTPRIHLPLPIHSCCLKAMLHWGSLGVVWQAATVKIIDGRWMSRNFLHQFLKGKWSQVPSFLSHPFKSNIGFTTLHHYNTGSRGPTLVVMSSKNLLIGIWWLNKDCLRIDTWFWFFRILPMN